MTVLPKDALLFILGAETDEAILILENLLDARMPAAYYNDIINHSLKDKSNTVLKIKEIIVANGLDSREAIVKSNQEINRLLLRKKTEHRAEGIDTAVKDESALESMESQIEFGEQAELLEFNHADYLTDMEFQAYMSISDKAIDTSAINDLPDKTRRYYMRMALGKMRIVKWLQGSLQ